MKTKTYFYGLGAFLALVYFLRPRTSTWSDNVKKWPGPDGVPSVRNNNPFNLIKTGTPWLGKVTNLYPDTDGFEKFIDYRSGFRAGLKNLKTQYGRGYNSIEKLIKRVTPPRSAGGDNSNEAVDDFVHAVAAEMGHNIKTQFPWTKDNVQALCNVVTRVEAGKPNFSPEIFNELWPTI